MALCWSCKVREYIQYNTDEQGVLRCPGCGELKQDAPKTPATTKPTPSRRGTAKK